MYSQNFSRLLGLCRSKDVTLVGVSEDTKSRAFLNYLSRIHRSSFPSFLNDVSALSLLSKNKIYRTIEFVPKLKFSNKDSLFDSGLYFPTVYVKPTLSSNPLRIDVCPWKKALDEVIQIIVNLSQGSGAFGYPIPLYLVHLDARIDPTQSDWSSSRLIQYLSELEPDLFDSLLKERRRDIRPNH